MVKLRGSILHQLAERAAAHPRIEGAVVQAIRRELPAVLETLIAEEAERQGSTVLRLYGRRSPTAQREARDAAILAALQAGRSPADAALEARCSLRHVYYVRAKSAL